MEYYCEGFLEKNRDTVHEEQINILKASKVKLPMGKIDWIVVFGHYMLFMAEVPSPFILDGSVLVNLCRTTSWLIA